MSRRWAWLWSIVIGVPLAVFAVWAVWDNARLFTVTLLNGLTLGSLYFIVAGWPIALMVVCAGVIATVNLLWKEGEQAAPTQSSQTSAN